MFINHIKKFIQSLFRKQCKNKVIIHKNNNIIEINNFKNLNSNVINDLYKSLGC